MRGRGRDRRWCAALLALAVLGAAAPAWSETAASDTAVVIHSQTRGAAQDLPARLLRPAGDGPFPAVVILHDCSGLGPNSSGAPARWAQLLTGQGYVAIVADSFAPRGFPNGVCTEPPDPRLRDTLPAMRVGDAYATLAFLRTLPFVDGKRIGVMGGSHGAATTLTSLVTPLDPDRAAARRAGFAAGVALYPGCGAAYGPSWHVRRQGGATGPVVEYFGTYQPTAPLLILIGAEDDWTPAEACRVLAERAAAAGYPVTIKIYPGAYHSFDSSRPLHHIATYNNPNKPDGRGATVGGNQAAWTDAITQVTDFFARQLKGAP